MSFISQPSVSTLSSNLPVSDFGSAMGGSAAAMFLFPRRESANYFDTERGSPQSGLSSRLCLPSALVQYSQHSPSRSRRPDSRAPVARRRKWMPDCARPNSPSSLKSRATQKSRRIAGGGVFRFRLPCHLHERGLLLHLRDGALRGCGLLRGVPAPIRWSPYPSSPASYKGESKPTGQTPLGGLSLRGRLDPDFPIRPTPAGYGRWCECRSVGKVPQPGQCTSSHGIPATMAARIVGDPLICPRRSRAPGPTAQ